MDNDENSQPTQPTPAAPDYSPLFKSKSLAFTLSGVLWAGILAIWLLLGGGFHGHQESSRPQPVRDQLPEEIEERIAEIQRQETEQAVAAAAAKAQRQKAEKAAETARQLLENEQFDQAEIYVLRALEEFPKEKAYKDLQKRIQNAKLRKQEIARAKTLADESQQLYLKGDVLNALEKINEALALDDNRIYQARKGQILGEIDAYKRKMASVWAVEAQKLLDAGDVDEAWKKINLVLETYPDDVKYLELKMQIQEKRSQKAEELAQEARWNFQDGKLMEARQKINLAIQYSYQSEADSYLELKKQIQEKCVEQAEDAATDARRYLNEGKLENAMREITSAIELNPDSKAYPLLKEKIQQVFDEDTRKAGAQMVKTVDDVDYAFCWCPAGTFVMGDDSYESRAHNVVLTQGFWMLETEVTQKMWKSVMGDNPSHFQGSDLPVENVDWEACQDFCRKLSRRMGMKVSLPTEAQWEYACRAGSTGAFAGELDAMGWYYRNSDSKTYPVGKKEPNAWGLYDMHGNVSEWCLDWYEFGYSRSGNAMDPTGPDNGYKHVCRGGHYESSSASCQSSNRDSYSSRSSTLGFRIVVSRSAVPASEEPVSEESEDTEESEEPTLE